MIPLLFCAVVVPLLFGGALIAFLDRSDVRDWWREVCQPMCDCGAPATYEAHDGEGVHVADFCRRCTGVDL